MRIKLITYNILHGRYLDKVIDFLRTEGPDIICLQEVGVSGHDQAEKEINLFEILKDELGMPGRYEHMFWGDLGNGKYDIGVAIFTKLPILESKTFAYERETEAVLDGANKDRYNLPRKLLGLKLQLGGEELWTFVAHHTITPKGGVTVHQLDATRKVKDFLSDYDRYLLCGDMNTPLGNENYKLLSEGLTDVSGIEPTLHPMLHKVGHMGLHVDYVFTKGEGIRPLSTQVGMVDASDHLPVVVELEV